MILTYAAACWDCSDRLRYLPPGNPRQVIRHDSGRASHHAPNLARLQQRAGESALVPAWVHIGRSFPFGSYAGQHPYFGAQGGNTLPHPPHRPPQRVRIGQHGSLGRQIAAGEFGDRLRFGLQSLLDGTDGASEISNLTPLSTLQLLAQVPGRYRPSCGRYLDDGSCQIGGQRQAGRGRQEHHGRVQQEHSVGKGVVGSYQLCLTGARAGKLLEHPEADGRDHR